MGSAPACNIEIKVSEERAMEIMEEIAEQTDFEDHRGDSYRYNWNNKYIDMVFSEGRDEYLGVGAEESVVLHYSAYYTDERDVFMDAVSKMDELEPVVKDVIDSDEEMSYYMSVATI